MTAPRPDSREQRVLLLPPQAEGILIRTVLSQAGLPFAVCAGIEDLCREWEAGAGAVLLAEEQLDQTAMHHLVEGLGRQPVWSDLPLVVFFGGGEHTTESSLRMLGMLEPLGNVMTLERPVRIMALVSALRSALRARCHQYEVRDLLRQKEETVQGRDEFLTLLAHELRNPLSTIQNANQILERMGSRATVAVQQRAVIGRQTADLARLIGDVLDVYRVRAGKLVLQRAPVDLLHLARRCLQDVDAAVKANGHRLSFTVEAEPVTVEGDPARLEQVVCHLLTNAVKYTPPGGRIAVAVAVEGDQAVLRVRDTGTGISPDVLPHLFDLFTGVRPASEHPEGGLKIGLKLVRSLVELHGGSVSVASAGPGHGSEFVVTLPVYQAPAEAIAAPASVAPAAAPRRILVVEDNADGRETLRLMLLLWGYEVETADNGPHGVQKALARRPEAALIDIGLPGLDGYEVARQIRAALGRGIALMAVTGYGQPHDRRRALEAGFDAHLVKPVDPDALHQLLAGSQGNARQGLTHP